MPIPMWTTVALAALLGSALGQSDGLTISNVRMTYGELGPERSDSKMLPGDRYELAFDVEGLKIDDNGIAKYMLDMEVLDSQGKRIFGQEPRDFERGLSLGGSRMPMHVFVLVGLSQPPGEYTVKVSVTDRATKATGSLTRKFEVLAKGFGIVRPQASYDSDGLVLAPLQGEAGQSLYLNFAVVGFSRSQAQKNQPDIAMEMRVLDAEGKPTVPKTLTGRVNELVADNVIAIPASFLLQLNRSGKFTIELKATDQVTKKTSKLALPLTVTEQKATTGTAER
jgi:hypothetical protein